MPRTQSIFGPQEPSTGSNDEDNDEVHGTEDIQSSSSEYESPTSPVIEDSGDESIEDDSKEDSSNALTSEDNEINDNEAETSDEESIEYSKIRNRKTQSKDAEAWLKYTAEERAVIDSLEKSDSTDLTTQILNSHGLAALGYATLSGHVNQLVGRKKWTSGWTPRITWDMWPLRPSTVPRRREKVWATSLSKAKAWTPSQDLEDEMFSCMLRKARENWEGGLTVDAAAESAQKLSQWDTDDLLDQPVLSTDDDKSYRILKPMVRSSLSRLDTLLRSVQLSASSFTTSGPVKDGKTRRARMRKGTRHSADPRHKAYIDWSHVLSLAAVSGMSAQVISRAATRCSAAFGESITLQSLHNDNTTCLPTTRQTFRPDDIKNENDPSQRLLPESKQLFELNKRNPVEQFLDGCKLSYCNFWANDKGRVYKTGSRYKEHLLRMHDWPFGQFGPKDIDEHVGIQGGVHNDGFLTPIDPQYMLIAPYVRQKPYYTDCRIDPSATPPSEERREAIVKGRLASLKRSWETSREAKQNPIEKGKKVTKNEQERIDPEIAREHAFDERWDTGDPRIDGTIVMKVNLSPPFDLDPPEYTVQCWDHQWLSISANRAGRIEQEFRRR